jgi:hypothetical protein
VSYLLIIIPVPVVAHIGTTIFVRRSTISTTFNDLLKKSTLGGSWKDSICGLQTNLTLEPVWNNCTTLASRENIFNSHFGVVKTRIEKVLEQVSTPGQFYIGVTAASGDGVTPATSDAKTWRAMHSTKQACGKRWENTHKKKYRGQVFVAAVATADCLPGMDARFWVAALEDRLNNAIVQWPGNPKLMSQTNTGGHPGVGDYAVIYVCWNKVGDVVN